MRILHVVNSNVLNGGIGTVLNSLNEGLYEQSHISVTLKTYSNEMGKGGYEVLRENKDNFELPIYHPETLENELKQYDVVHIHGIPTYRILEAVEHLKSKEAWPKIINTCHSSVKKELLAHLEKSRGTEDADSLEKMIEKGLLSNPSDFNETFWGSAVYRQEKVMTLADSVQHMNNSYLDEILREYAAQENRYKQQVVYNGVKIMPESDLTPLPKQKRILFSGRFSPEKGIDEFIESLPYVLDANPDAQIRIMGGDKEGILVRNYQEKLEKVMIDHFGYNEKTKQLISKVNFTGWVSDQKKIEQNYDWCDFIVIPSTDESFCLAVAEALNHERIPIMTNTPSLYELFLSNDVGFGIERYERNGRGIARVVNKSLSQMNEPTLERMAKKGRKLVEDKYDLKKIIKEQIDQYRKLISA